jgi:hypothetical protein
MRDKYQQVDWSFVSVFANLDLQVCVTHLKPNPSIDGPAISCGIARGGNANTVAVPRFNLCATVRIFDFDRGKFFRKRLFINCIADHPGLRWSG